MHTVNGLYRLSSQVVDIRDTGIYRLKAALAVLILCAVCTVAFTARAGEYRLSRTANKAIAPPPDNALEARFGKADVSSFVVAPVLGNTAVCPAGIFRHEYVSANWAEAFDGVLVLDHEYAPHSTRR